MADLGLDFGDTVERTAHDLASMQGVHLANARPETVRLWEARGLALHHLAAGDMDEALKVMCPVRPLLAIPRQPPSAAKETT